MLARIAVLFVAVVAAHAASAAEMRFDGLSEDEVSAFLGALQVAVRADKPDAVADLVIFPLRVNTATKRAFVKTRGEFSRSYAKIFTPAVKAAVLKQVRAICFGTGRAS